MIAISLRLKEIIERARPKLLAVSDARASEKPYADKWSVVEILGHLIDSAANNHHRIVRMQETADIGRFTYTQQHWVRCQGYHSEPWNNVVEFWYSYNAHLAHIIAHVDPASLDHTCDMGYSKPATLKFLIEDYLRHVEHHLGQIFGDADPREREKWVRGDPEQSL